MARSVEERRRALQAIIQRRQENRPPRQLATVETVRPSVGVEDGEVEEGGGGGMFGGFADAFRSVVPQGVRDVGGTVLNDLTSAEAFLNNPITGDTGTAIMDRVDDIPVVGGLAREVVDTVASPLSLATIGFGPQLALALRGGGRLGRAAATFAEPLTAGGLRARAGAEAAAMALGVTAAEGAEAIGAPAPIQVAAGLVGGIGGARGFRRGQRLREAGGLARLTDEEFQREVTSGDPVRKVTALIRNAEPKREQVAKAQTAERVKREHRIQEQLKRATTAEEAFTIIRRGQRGELPKGDFEAIRGQVTDDEMRALEQRLLDFTGFRNKSSGLANTYVALTKLMTGQIPQKHELWLLERVYGRDFTNALLAKRSLGSQAFDVAMDAIGVPRTLLAAFDASAPFRQGAMLAVSRPRQFAGAWKPMIGALGSETYARAVDDAIRTAPLAPLREGSRLYLAPLDDLADITQREEAYVSRMLRNVPLIGAGVRASERAYITFLNKLRADTFDSVVGKWQRAGYEPTTEDIDRLGMWLNSATGRGNLPSNALVAGLNHVFFSPRYLASRLEVLNPATYSRATPAVRKEMARDIAGFFGTGMLGLGLLKAADETIGVPVDIEIDPRSSDFAKIRVGDTRFDVWSGFQPLARYATQLLTNVRKASSGDIQELNRAITAGRFVQSKLAPSPGLLVDALRGESFVGEEVDVTTAGGLGEQAANRLVSLFAQDLAEAIREEGLIGGLMALPSGVGFGVQTYSSVQSVRDAGAGELYDGMKWSELTSQERAHVEEVYAEEFAKQRDPGEGTIRAFIDRENVSVRQEQQEWNEARQSGLTDARTFTRLMTDRLIERSNRIDGAVEQAGLRRDDTGLLGRFFALREQATVGGVVDYELLEQLQANFRSGLSSRERKIIDERRAFVAPPEVKWWYDAKDEITGSGYWREQDVAMDQVRGLLESFAPGVETYNQLNAAARMAPDPLTAARLEAVVKRVDQITRQRRLRLRATNPELDAALVAVYGLSPIRGR